MLTTPTMIRARALAAAICVALMPTAAMAEDRGARDTADEAEIGEIVVTALRRSERLQDVPASISALGDDQLEQQKVNGANDLAGIIPNLQAATTVGDSAPIFSL